MNKFLLTLLCSGSLMTLAGCGKPEETKVVETEVAVSEVKNTEAVEIDVNAAEVVEKAVAVVEEKQVTTVEVADKQQDDKF
jgi:uncharacterized protein YcfL